MRWIVAAMKPATRRILWIPTGLFAAASVLLLAAATVGTTQLLAAEPPCGPGELCIYRPFSAFLFTGTFLVAAGLAQGAALLSLGSRATAAILGCLALAVVAILLILFVKNGGFPVPTWTLAGPALVALGLFAVIPIPARATLALVAFGACAGLVVGVAVVFRSSSSAAAPTPTPTPAPAPVGNNLGYLQRRDPRPADVAALRPAASDLDRALQDLRARHLSDEAATRQTLEAYPTLEAARVHTPPSNEKLFDRNTTVVVVVEYGSACLIGELGSADATVHLVGHTQDGGCEALYGH